MFGGIAFTIAGKTWFGVIDSKFMIRANSDRFQDALDISRTRPMELKGKPLKGFVCIEAECIEKDDDLYGWINAAIK